MQINSVSDFRRAYRNGPYAWPGGYPLYFITSDGGALSYEAAKGCRREILDSIATETNDGWRVIACEINYEDGDLYCDHTNSKIESAYAD
jgi:hypothetical protein